MKRYIKALVLAAAVAGSAGLTSCDDFLNLMPEDKLVPENYFTDAANLSAYTLPFYNNFTTHSNYTYALGTFSADNGTDNQVAMSAPSQYVPGEWRVSSGSDNWGFGTIRQLNFFFAHALKHFEAGDIAGSMDEAKQALGEAYFFRAFAYWQYYSAVGDYPIIDGVLPDDKGVLLEASKRQPRHKVARYILDDLANAVKYLPAVSSKGKNGLNKDCANLFRSRVALFEGTWLKNHKGTALVPGGPGWPGDQSLLAGFNIDTEINYFLTEAMASAKEVGDAFVNNLVENTDTPEGMTEGFKVANPYYCMFSVPNPSVYSEVLLYKSYNITLGQKTQIQNQFQRNGGGSGWTRGLVNSYLMRNGLPIYAQGSGYDPEWENQGVTASLKDRDSRIQIFTKGDESIITLGIDGKTPQTYNMGWLLFGRTETKAVTGYAIKKGQGYDYNETQGNLVSITGSIIFRASEALLNYMEAKVEKDGKLDDVATSYWKALRARAKVDTDVMKTVNATDMSQEALYDWGAYSQGKLVSTLLYNVRRERRNELAGEMLRSMDLRRWCAMDQLAANPYQIEGIKYWGTVYSDLTNPMCMKDESGTPLAAIVSPSDGRGTMSAETESKYVRPFQITNLQNLVWNGLKWTRAHYLSPLGAQVFIDASPDKKAETSVVYQNPGWSKLANEGATAL